MEWNKTGHWLEYEIHVQHAGYYQIVFRYARGDAGDGVRAIRIDGEFPFEGADAISFPSTNGWANWRFIRLRWPDFVDQPFLVKLEPGARRLRLENVNGGGVNLDYIAVAHPKVEITREALEK